LEGTIVTLTAIDHDPGEIRLRAILGREAEASASLPVNLPMQGLPGLADSQAERKWRAARGPGDLSR
jgi:hypothetical protein